MGKVFKFGDNIDTDVIIPAVYLSNGDPELLAPHCMEPADPDFYKKVKAGDIIIAGENFGCGSSREHAPMAIKACGIKACIASSFARIFYRNAVNTGLPILECPQAVKRISDGDEVLADTATGIIRDVTTGEEFTAIPFDPYVQDIIKQGGLLKKVMKDRNAL